MKAHPTALVDPAAELADDVQVGPFCVIGPGVKVGPGCRLGARVILEGEARLGRDNILHPHVSIGRVRGGRIEIGDGNVLRESTHVDAPPSGGATRIGSRNHFGSWVGVGAGCEVGSDVRLGSLSVLGEGAVVQDRALIEGQCVIEAGMRIGQGCLIRSQVPVVAPVPPFMCLDGNPAGVQGANPYLRTPGLEAAFETAFRSGLTSQEAARKLRELASAPPEVEILAGFLAALPPAEDSGE